jgi:hypothetical protein
VRFLFLPNTHIREPLVLYMAATIAGTPDPNQEELLQDVKNSSGRYKLYARAWATTHYVVGAVSAVLAFFVGASRSKVGPPLFGDWWALILGSLAAVAAGLVTTLEANARASRYDHASSILSTAAAFFRARYPTANAAYMEDLRQDLARAFVMQMQF